MVQYTDPTAFDLAAKEETPRRESKPRKEAPASYQGRGWEVSQGESRLTNRPFANL